MSNPVFTLTKVVYITLMAMLIVAVWFLYDHFSSTENIRLDDEVYIAVKRPASYAGAVQQAAPAVVSLQTSKTELQQNGLGSGIIIDSAGHILTNHHVVENTKQITAKLPDGRSAIAQLVGTDIQTDLAVLQININDLPTAKLGTSNNLQVGDVVLAIGNPLGLNSSVTQGIISALGAVHEISANEEYANINANLIQTDAAINLGNSGGALIDVRGQVIGVNTAMLANMNGSQGIGFAIPIDTAKDVAQQIITNGKVTRGWIGAQLTTIQPDTRQYLGLPDLQGVYVQDTIRNSPAQKAGILPGDIITKINKVATSELPATLQLIANLKPEYAYEIEVFRDGKLFSYDVLVEVRA